MKMLRGVALSLGLLAIAACGADNTNPDYEGTAMVSLNNLMHWMVVSGTFEVQTTPVQEYTTDKVELVRVKDGVVIATANKEPFSLSWDTTLEADGVTSILVRATDIKSSVVESPAVQLVVLNQGQAASYVLGSGSDTNTGEVYIPDNYDGTQEVDVLKHWNSPAGVKAILAVLSWNLPDGQTAWDIGLSVGQGICPHRGKQYGPEIRDTESPMIHKVLSTQMSPPADEFPETPIPADPLTNQYFVHLRPNTPGDHRGESLPFQVDVYLLQ